MNKKYVKFFTEMAKPRPEDTEKKYYHGTSTRASAESILKTGIQPPDLGNRKGRMTPVKGKIYLTPDLPYGVIYALGGSMIGNDMSDMKSAIEEPKGYLFVVSGEQLKDIQPDEDFIGELIGMDASKHNCPQWLKDMARYNLTLNQFKKVLEGDYSYWAQAGKKLVKLMSDSQKLELISLGAHIAHGGTIIPDEAWEFDKSLSIQLKKDCSNFFQLAKKLDMKIKNQAIPVNNRKEIQKLTVRDLKIGDKYKDNREDTLQVKDIRKPDGVIIMQYVRSNYEYKMGLESFLQDIEDGEFKKI